MCAKCEHAEQASPTRFTPVPPFEPDWETIPADYTEVRVSENGNVWAMSDGKRMKLQNAPDCPQSEVGRVFHGGMQHSRPSGWKVIAKRPAPTKQYFIVTPGGYPVLIEATTEQAEAKLIEAGPGAYLYEGTPRATVHEIRTTTTEVVWSN